MRVSRSSLAARLMLWYATTAFLLVAGAALIQYRTLLRSLAEEDDHDLAAQLGVMSHAPSSDGRRQAADTPTRLRVRQLDEACRPFQSVPSDLPPPDCPKLPSSTPSFRTWESPTGDRWRVAVAHLPGPSGGWSEVLLNRSGDEGVLRAYREKLAIVLAVALLVATVLGYGIARRGLRPLDRLARRVAVIDARSLERRLTAGEDSRGDPAEIATLVASFDGMLERLARAFRALTDYTGELAHELRTPIHVLRQQAEVALNQARSHAEYRDVLVSSLEELDRMRCMVDNILFLARAEDPRADVERVQLHVADECAGVVDFLHADAAERGITLVSEVSPALELSADRMLLRRALVNVVSNALRYTPSGGHVAIAGREVDSVVTVEIRDTGTGIPEALLPRVFDRYVRGADSSSRHPDGTGLGLAIVRGIMMLHGGTATIASAPGEGTFVTLLFPKQLPSAVPITNT